MTHQPPALVAVSHGTSSAEGRAAVRGLYDAVVTAAAERWGEAAPETRLGHVDVEQPDVPTSLASLPSDLPAVVVPLLVSAGYHVHVDLADAAEAARAGGREVAVADALGPDDRILAVLRRQLAEAGARDGDALVLVAAGSSDARAVVACRDAGEALASAIGARVTVGFLSAAEPRLADAIDSARADAAHGRVAVANYLLAPGYFHDLAADARPDVLAAALLRADAPAPPELVDLVLDRYAASAGSIGR